MLSSAAYYFENAQRFADPNFQPSDIDVMNVKVRTTGIREINFEINKALFTIVDVGGQVAVNFLFRGSIYCYLLFKSLLAVLYY